MARHPRLVVAGAPHHVYLRGNNRRLLFSSRSDRVFWLSCLRRGLDLSRCQLHQLTLMTNHIHMIVTPPEANALSEMMKRACQRYAQMRNEERGASGKLFEERFRSKVITDDSQMMMTSFYNDANAFRAGEVTDPLGHEWSTGPLHAGRPGSSLIASIRTPSRWYRALAPTAAGRSEAYLRLMAAYLGDEAPRQIEQGVEEIEDPADKRWNPRVRRPNGTSARDGDSLWQHGRIPSKRR
jgi:putative transposase